MQGRASHDLSPDQYQVDPGLKVFYILPPQTFHFHCSGCGPSQTSHKGRRERAGRERERESLGSHVSPNVVCVFSCQTNLQSGGHKTKLTGEFDMTMSQAFQTSIPFLQNQFPLDSAENKLLLQLPLAFSLDSNTIYGTTIISLNTRCADGAFIAHTKHVTVVI